MAVFDCGKDIRDFHNDEVTLGLAEQTDMRERRDNGRRRLEIGLDDSGHPQPSLTCSQGSYAMHTMVHDDDLDYDIDDGIYFEYDDLLGTRGNELTPQQAKERVCAALSRDKRFADPAEVFPKCVRQVYAVGYHIDMPVYRIRIENKGEADEGEIIELAGDGSWDESDARATTRWFRNKVSEVNGDAGVDGSQLRRIVRLTKAFARSRKEWKEKTTSGIVISKLVVDYFVAVPNRDDDSLLRTWKAVRDKLLASTAVAHPVNAAPLAEDGNPKVVFFRDKLKWALNELEVVELDDCTRAEARAAWDSVFNTDYISKRPGPKDSGDGKKAFFVSTANKTDTRDDGNGRFG
jgi:hypothetical protein